MKFLFKKLIINLILFFNFFSCQSSFADNHNIYEILEKLQNMDLNDLTAESVIVVQSLVIKL